MDVAITGSSGFIGSALIRSLEADGHRPVRITRSESAKHPGTSISWDPLAGTIDAGALEGIDAVVHLAGEGIASSRWTESQKLRICESRTHGTTLLAETLAGLERKPRVLISQSAIGYYGPRGDEDLDETSSPADDFLARVCVEWESATDRASAAGIPVAHTRTGLVLSSGGGMLAKILLPFKLGLGGRVGDGKQWMSWIALADVVGSMRYILDRTLSGPFNLTAPVPVTNRHFTAALGAALHRPTLIPIPSGISKLPLGIGQLAESLLLASAKVHPRALTEAGYGFTYSTIEDALGSMLGRAHEQA